MASYNELNALIDAYINRNGVQAITGQILNGVLKAMVEQLGRGYTIMGAAEPTTDPGTPDGPECWFASETGTYTDFDGLQVVPGELALLCYTPTDGWTKATIYEGFQQVEATIDGNVGTPSVGVSYADGVLSFDFRNLKGNTGDPAGFGTIAATVDGNIGTPGVSVQTSGPDTAKNITFAFRNLKGETGVTSVVATVDNTSGNPQCAVSLNGQQLTLAFTGLKGAQGDTGSSVDYPFTIVNNLTTNDATQALSAAMGVQLESEISQLRQEVTADVSQLEAEMTEKIGFGIVTDKDFIDGYRINASTGADQSDTSRAVSPYLPVYPGAVVTFSGSHPNNTLLYAIYDKSYTMIANSGNLAGYTAIREDYTMPADAAYIRFVRVINQGTTCTITVSPGEPGYTVDFLDKFVTGNLAYFRNGSVGNAGNTQYIFSAYIFPFRNFKKVGIYTNRPPTSGNEYRFCFQTYGREVGIPGAEHAKTAYIRNVTTYATTNQFVTPQSGEYGIGFGVGEFVKGTNTVSPIRVSSFSGYVLTIYGITENDEIIKQDILDTTGAADSALAERIDKADVAVAELEDAIASPETLVLTTNIQKQWQSNSSTAVGTTIAMETVTDSNKAVNAIPVTHGQVFTVGVRRYRAIYYIIFVDSDYGFISGDALGSSLDPALVSFTVTVPAGASYMLLNSYSTDPTAVWENNYDAIKAATSPTIISLNKDVEVAVNAASNYMYKPNNTAKMLSLLITTDVHGDSTRFVRSMQYLKAIPSIDMGMCLGDMQAANFSGDVSWYINAVLASTKNYLTVIGNHDAGNDASTTTSGTMEQIFEKYIQPLASKMGITPTENYYAVHDTTKKVSIIVLNCHDLPDTLIDSDTFAVPRSAWAFSQDQIDWFVSELATIPSDHHLLLVYHWLGDANAAVSGVWSQPGYNNINNTEKCYDGIIGDIINAWKNGTTLSKTYEPQKYTAYLSDISVSADFTLRGTGVFVAHLTGHTHRDCIVQLTQHTDQKAVCLVQTANDNYQNFSDLPRAIGTKAEDAITVLSINTEKRILNLVRVGANVTNTMVQRTVFCLPY